MGAKLLSGKEVSESMLAKVLADAEMLIEKGITPTLAIFRIGEDPGSISYEKSSECNNWKEYDFLLLSN